jgi:hypothetical protein
MRTAFESFNVLPSLRKKSEKDFFEIAFERFRAVLLTCVPTRLVAQLKKVKNRGGQGSSPAGLIFGTRNIIFTIFM